MYDGVIGFLFSNKTKYVDMRIKVLCPLFGGFGSIMGLMIYKHDKDNNSLPYSDSLSKFMIALFCQMTFIYVGKVLGMLASVFPKLTYELMIMCYIAYKISIDKENNFINKRIAVIKKKLLE